MGNRYVQQLEERKQKGIEKELRKVIRDMDDYTEEELNGHVERAMGSRLGELSETIDIKKYL